MSGTDVQNTPTLEERVTERLREDIGSLMSDEELAKIVDRAIENIFFKPRVRQLGVYGNSKEAPSWFQELVQSTIKARVLELFEEAWKARSEEIEKAIADGLRERAPEFLASAMVQGLSNATESGINTWIWQLRERLQQL